MVKTDAGSPVSAKGQVTIPIEIRKRLGVAAGDRVTFVLTNGKVVIQAQKKRPRKSIRDYFGAWKGAFKDEQEILDWVAAQRDGD